MSCFERCPKSKGVLREYEKFNCVFVIMYICGCVCIQESHTGINPHGIVAIGPDLDFTAPHDRATRCL